MTESEVAHLSRQLQELLVSASGLDIKLTAHIESSALSSELVSDKLQELNSTLTKAVDDTQKLYSSLPEDKHGRPSIFRHKEDHLTIAEKEESQRNETDDRRRIRASFWDSAASMAGKMIMIIVAMVVLGEKAPYFFHLILG